MVAEETRLAVERVKNKKASVGNPSSSVFRSLTCDVINKSVSQSIDEFAVENFLDWKS